jgi:hypothetical protein
MPEIISLAERKRARIAQNPYIIEKVVDGKIVECVNVDALPPQLLSRFLSLDDEEKAPQP